MTRFNQVIVILFFILILSSGAFAITPDEFPPLSGSDTGDYILIGEPGRYTLEHDISHLYPVGIIITASSVILDGQGYSISPASSGTMSTAGVWVSSMDGSGEPISGVSLQNLTIDDESWGLYAEGKDSSEVPWGRSNRENTGITEISPQNLLLSDLQISGCGQGIVLTNQSGAQLSGILVSRSGGSGITVRGGQARIFNSVITGNQGFGIEMIGSSDSKVSDSVIDQNKGVAQLVLVQGIRFENITHGEDQSFIYGPDSTEVFVESLENNDKKSSTTLPTEGVFHLNPKGTVTLTPVVPDSIQDPAEEVLTLANLTSTVPVSPIPSTTSDISEPIATITPVPVPTPLSIMSGIHATIIGDTIPSQMEKGRSYQAGLQLINDGSEDWIEQYQVGIMALEESEKLGPEWMPTLGGPVKSGQSQIVQFTLMSPSKPGSYTLKYQAAREGSGVQVLFGRPYTKTVTVT